MFRRTILPLCLLGIIVVPIAAAAHRHRPAHAANAGCSGAYPGTANPANPLMLADPSSTDPLTGADLFVDGPRHGAAARAIVRLLGRNPDRYSSSVSWARFARSLRHGALKRKLARHRRLARSVALLSKIAAQPEEARFWAGSAGGGPGKIHSQVQQFFCDTMQADPGSIPVITTYFLYQRGYCESASTILAYRSRFQRQVSEFAAAIGRRPAIVLMELDAIGASRCMARTGALPLWEQDIAYEISKVSALPHTVAYLEAGYADANPPGYTAQVFNAVGGNRIRGFFTNDTHNDWTIDEIRWGNAVSRRTHGAHFIVSTATNGRGPKLNPDPVHQGIEDLCNAPGRGLGPAPTTSTGFSKVDAFLWTGVPGNSAGSCRGGPPAGYFWPTRAIGLAARAQGKLGPGFAADKY